MKSTNLFNVLTRTIALALAASTLMACTNFSDQHQAAGIETTRFDDRFALALEEVFATCSEPLSINPGDEKISLTAGCNSVSDVSSTNGQLVTRVIEIIERMGGRAVSPQEARNKLRLRGADR